MALEFEIGVVDKTPGGAQGQAAQSGQAALTPAEMAQLKKQFGDALAEMIARQGVVHAAPVGSSSPAAGVPSTAQQTIEQQIVPALAANAGAVATLLRETPKEAALAQAEEGGILPPLEELRLQGGIEPGDILPADLRLAAEMPGEAADRARREMRAKAARQNLEEGPAEIEEPLEVVSLAHEQAQAQIEAGKHAARVKAARANLEEGPADVINPADEARQASLKQTQEQLNSGSRVAAQAGAGATGQFLGGVGDLAVGLGTGNAVQAVEGGLEVLQAGVHATAEAFDSARQAVELYSHDVQSAAGNDYWAVLDGHLQATSEALEKLPIVGEAVAAGFDAMVAPVRAFHDIVEAFVARGQQLKGFSPELAEAGAMAEVRTLLEDLHEADTLGPDLARLTEAQSQLGAELRELLLPIKEWLLEHLAFALEAIVEAVQGVRVASEESKELLSILRELLNDIFGSGKMADVPDLMRSVDRRLKEAADRAREAGDPDASKFFEQFMRMEAPRRGPDRDAARDAAGRQPPLFNQLPGF